MDNFLDNIKINKLSLKQCALCPTKEKMRVGDIYCKKCVVKVSKLENNVYRINYSSGN